MKFETNRVKNKGDIKGDLLCPFLEDVKYIFDVPRVSILSFRSKYPTDIFL